MRIYKLCLTDVLSWLEQFFTVGISTHWRTIHNLSEYQINSNSRISTLNERTSLLTGGGSWGKPSNLLEHRGLDSTTYLAGKHLISFIFVSILLLLVLKVPHHLLQIHGSSNFPSCWSQSQAFRDIWNGAWIKKHVELESQQPCLVLSYGDRVVLWEIAQGLWNPCQMPKSPLRSIIMDNLYHLPCA